MDEKARIRQNTQSDTPLKPRIQGRVQARAPGLGLVPRLAAPPFGSNFVHEAMQVLENQGHGVVHWSCHHPCGFGCFGG